MAPLTDKARRLMAIRDAARAEPQEAPQHPATTEEGLGLGIYMTHNRNTAIVANVGQRLVHFVTMMNGSIELLHWSKDRFVHEFNYRLEGYPLRRAARVYTKSYLDKTETAVRALNLLLARG